MTVMPEKLKCFSRGNTHMVTLKHVHVLRWRHDPHKICQNKDPKMTMVFSTARSCLIHTASYTTTKALIGPHVRMATFLKL